MPIAYSDDKSYRPRRNSATNGAAYASPTIVIMPTFSRSAVCHTDRGSSFLLVSYTTTGVPAMTAENAVHMPAACISGETANHGGPQLRTLS